MQNMTRELKYPFRIEVKLAKYDDPVIVDFKWFVEYRNLKILLDGIEHTVIPGAMPGRGIAAMYAMDSSDASILKMKYGPAIDTITRYSDIGQTEDNNTMEKECKLLYKTNRSRSVTQQQWIYSSSGFILQEI